MKGKVAFRGWTVLDKHGQIKRYAVGHGVRELIMPTKKEAFESARLLAEREDELTSGDMMRWEYSDMPFAQVKRMGYRVVRAEVVVRT